MDYTLFAANTSENAGRLVGRFVVAPLIMYFIGYGIVRLLKKRKPVRKEKIIIICIVAALTVMSLIGAAAQSASNSTMTTNNTYTN